MFLQVSYILFIDAFFVIFYVKGSVSSKSSPNLKPLFPDLV